MMKLSTILTRWLSEHLSKFRPRRAARAGRAARPGRFNMNYLPAGKDCLRADLPTGKDCPWQKPPG